MTGIQHLAATFTAAEREHPDLMEPYAARLAEAETSQERMHAMWAGLRETFRQRYPMAAERWPKREAA